MKTKKSEGIFLTCYHCLHKWYYRGKRKEAALCPRCHGYVNMKAWQLELFLKEYEPQDVCTIQRTIDENRIRQILFDTDEIKETGQWYKW